MSKGFLLAMMEPLPGFEAEFHAWYDTEHVPERMAIAGFEAGQRFVCVTGWPRYVALYDLASLEVLQAPAYQSVAGTTVSPWTQRVRNNVIGRYRFTGTQVYPGHSKMGDQGPIIRMMLLRFGNLTVQQEAPLLEMLKKNFDGRAGVSQLRLFRSADAPEYLAAIDLNTAAEAVELIPGSLGPLAKHLDLNNSYVPYWRSRYNPT